MCVCVRAHMYIHVGADAYMDMQVQVNKYLGVVCVWKPEDNLRHLALHTNHFFFLRQALLPAYKIG